MRVYPLVFEPIYKPKIWGGRRIFAHFGRPPVGAEPIGESWELADLEEDRSRVAGGPARGKTLTELLSEWGRDLLAAAPLFEGRFPLLIKYLDAHQSLSVQVHPNENVARRLGGNVRIKHEAWYILAAEEGGVIYHGLAPGVSAAVFQEAMRTGQVEGVLRKIAVRPGECYYLPGGTPHALGAGVMVAEVQTPSDITYRTYDWGRVEPSTGRPRDLHLEQAMQCIDFDAPYPPARQAPYAITGAGPPMIRLLACPCFIIDRWQAAAGGEQTIGIDQLMVWIVLEGAGTIEGGAAATRFRKGDVLLLPAALTAAQVRLDTPTTWLQVTGPLLTR